MLLSAANLSIYSLFVKEGSQGISVIAITFFRFFLPLLICLPFFWWGGTLKELWPLKNIRLQFLRSVSVIGTQLAMIYYLTKASLLDANMLWCTGPIFIPILSRLFYGTRIPKITWLSIGISFLGVALVLKPDEGIFDLFSLFGLLSGIGMAISQVLYGVNMERGKMGENLFYLFFFCSALMVIPFFVWEDVAFDLNASKATVLAVIALSLASLFNQWFRGLAYRCASPIFLTPFLYFSVIVSGFFDWIVYRQTPDLWAYVGIALVLLGAGIKWQYMRRL